eukprot:294235-Prymnesium_polylepis.1
MFTHSFGGRAVQRTRNPADSVAQMGSKLDAQSAIHLISCRTHRPTSYRSGPSANQSNRTIE